MPESVLCAVPVKTVKLFGIPKSFAFILTDQRTILIPLTNEMLKQAIVEARDEAAAAGKGFAGKWAAQMKASLGYTSRFLHMAPDEILQNYPGNTVIPNSSFSKVRIQMREDANRDVTLWYLLLHGPTGKTKYELPSRTSDVVSAFKQAYGNRFKG